HELHPLCAVDHLQSSKVRVLHHPLAPCAEAREVRPRFDTPIWRRRKYLSESGKRTFDDFQIIGDSDPSLHVSPRRPNGPCPGQSSPRTPSARRRAAGREAGRLLGGQPGLCETEPPGPPCGEPKSTAPSRPG